MPSSKRFRNPGSRFTNSIIIAFGSTFLAVFLGTITAYAFSRFDFPGAGLVLGGFLAVMDRDFRSDDEVAAYERKHHGRVFVWRVHEIENLFLDPELVHRVLEFHDQLGILDSPEAVGAALDRTASSIRERIAGRWVAWRLQQDWPRLDAVGTAAHPLDALLKHAASLEPKVAELADQEGIKRIYEERLAEVDRIIAEGHACVELPGNEILAEFLRANTTLSTDVFIPTAVSMVLDRGISLPEVDRLVATIRLQIGLPSESD